MTRAHSANASTDGPRWCVQPQGSRRGLVACKARLHGPFTANEPRNISTRCRSEELVAPQAVPKWLGAALTTMDLTHLWIIAQVVRLTGIHPSCEDVHISLACKQFQRITRYPASDG